MLVVGIRLDPLLEGLIRHEDIVGREHHERASLLVLKLLRAVPLLPDPLLIQEELVELVDHTRRRERPGTLEARAVAVAASKSVATEQSDYFLVVEAGN